MNPAQALIDRLQYEIMRPEITTMGWCANACGNSARGGGRCTACLMEALTTEAGAEIADEAYYAIHDMHDARKRFAALFERAGV